MAGYGMKDANRMLREQKDTKPEAFDCERCEDTGFVPCGGTLSRCPKCIERELEAICQG